MRSITVALAGRTYSIHIGAGLLGRLSEFVAPLAPTSILVVTNEVVAPLHGDRALAALRGVARATMLNLPDGEHTKRWDSVSRILDALVEHGADRRSVVVALGGGVIGDLAGFAASIYMRGIRVVQVPTTLLAQVDSSVGGKTGINSRHGKNLVGAFHQPILVIADTALLDTLSTREFRAGYAEVAKFGLLGDAGFFTWLEANWQDVFAGGSSSGSFAREHAIAIACRGKAAVVARDERETGDRALLNLGHTFGHAFEAAAGFSEKLLHGEAVALGIVCAFEFSTRLGLLPTNEAGRVADHLAAVGLPTHIREMPVATNADALMALIAQDKKVKRGKLTFILMRGIGEAFVAPDVDPAEVRRFLAQKL